MWKVCTPPRCLHLLGGSLPLALHSWGSSCRVVWDVYLSYFRLRGVVHCQPKHDRCYFYGGYSAVISRLHANLGLVRQPIEASDLNCFPLTVYRRFLAGSACGRAKPADLQADGWEGRGITCWIACRATAPYPESRVYEEGGL